MTSAVQFPRALLREQSHSWNLLGVATAPGQTPLNGAVIVRSDGGGYWSCVMQDVSLSGGPGLTGRARQRQSTLLWRAVRQWCDGGTRSIVVPRNDALFRPWPAGVGHGTVRHSDGTLHADGVGYYQSNISVVTGAAASLRARSLQLTLIHCGPLLGGEAFSINHPNLGWRLYEIATVDYLDLATTVDVTFNPPLREAVPASTALEFDRPRCVMRLAKPSSMDLSVIPWTFNVASVDFMETWI